MELSLGVVLAVLFIVLTAVGGPNANKEIEYRCDCTMFTESLGYGLASSLLIEVFLIGIVVVWTAVVALYKWKECAGPLAYCAFATGTAVALNALAFLSMTVSVVVIVALGGHCCAGTSVAVTVLSAVFAVFKIACLIALLAYASCGTTGDSVKN